MKKSATPMPISAIVKDSGLRQPSSGNSASGT